jgi:hypothetical protein
MIIVTYFIAVCIEQILMSAPWKWQCTNAETCVSYVKDRAHKLCNNVFLVLRGVFFKFKSNFDDFHSHLNNNCFETCRTMYEDFYTLGTEIIHFRVYDRHRHWAVFFSSLCWSLFLLSPIFLDVSIYLKLPSHCTTCSDLLLFWEHFHPIL